MHVFAHVLSREKRELLNCSSQILYLDSITRHRQILETMCYNIPAFEKSTDSEKIRTVKGHINK